MNEPQLSAAQRRVLTEVREGRSVFNGRFLRSAKRLEREGLLRITSKRKVLNRLTGGTDWQITVEEVEP